MEKTKSKDKTPQRYAWRTVKTFATYTEADQYRRKHYGPKSYGAPTQQRPCKVKRAGMQFAVKVGTPLTDIGR